MISETNKTIKEQEDNATIYSDNIIKSAKNNAKDIIDSSKLEAQNIINSAKIEENRLLELKKESNEILVKSTVALKDAQLMEESSIVKLEEAKSKLEEALILEEKNNNKISEFEKYKEECELSIKQRSE